MENQEIKEANRKAMPMFILLVIAGAAAGGIMGFVIAKYGLHGFSENIERVADVFSTFVAPWMMFTIAVFVPLILSPYYMKTKKMLLSWDGEDEEISDGIEKRLSVIIWVTSCGLIISYFLIGAVYSKGLEIFDNNKGGILPFSVGVVAFMAILVEAVIFQQKCVDLAKIMNPEKKASVYDMRFQKKWMESCDEAEKIIVGKCAFKAYSVTNSVCYVLEIVLVICALAFGTGFLPVLVVCIIWLVNTSVYCRESMKYSKAGNKINYV